MPAPVASVDWEKVTRDVDAILAERAVKGPIKHRGQAELGEDLWELSLQQELAHDGSEGDKRRGRAYIHEVAAKAQQVQLPACTVWMRIRRVPCDKGD